MGLYLNQCTLSWGASIQSVPEGWLFILNLKIRHSVCTCRVAVQSVLEGWLFILNLRIRHSVCT
jgi:hypothetical protein